MLSVNYAECRKQALYEECCYAECRYAECRNAECWGANSGGYAWKVLHLQTLDYKEKLVREKHKHLYLESLLTGKARATLELSKRKVQILDHANWTCMREKRSSFEMLHIR
jgi:hypothetical protein